ncbi:MAG: hypothetical protein V4631_22060 [Pseudomonadota bacterium]
MKKLILIAVLACACTGCGSMIQAVNAYGAVAVSDARAANDTVIAGWTLAACATPISAALRNPQIIPALRALCLPPAGAEAGTLLDAAARPGRE